MLKLNICSDDLVVVSFDLGELLGHVLSVVIRHDHVAATDDDLHTHSSSHTTSSRLSAYPVRSTPR
jgi:hypothetical protein